MPTRTVWSVVFVSQTCFLSFPCPRLRASMLLFQLLTVIWWKMWINAKVVACPEGFPLLLICWANKFSHYCESSFLYSIEDNIYWCFQASKWFLITFFKYSTLSFCDSWKSLLNKCFSYFSIFQFLTFKSIVTMCHINFLLGLLFFYYHCYYYYFYYYCCELLLLVIKESKSRCPCLAVFECVPFEPVKNVSGIFNFCAWGNFRIEFLLGLPSLISKSKSTLAIIWILCLSESIIWFQFIGWD